MRRSRFVLIPWAVAICAGRLWAADGEALVRASGTQGGLIVHVGCGDGKLTAALRVNERYLVQGLTRNTKRVRAVRDHLCSIGKHGPVTVQHWPSPRLPYPDNFVNLLVVSDEGIVSRGELLRVLAPGGVALSPHSSPLAPIRKPWPEGMDEWTHWLHGADGNPVSQDTVVGLPRRMQWVAPPRWSRDHEKSPSLTGMVSARGRIFFIADEAPASIAGRLPDQWRLTARDAFNGLLLWKRLVPDWGWQAWSPKEPMNRRWGNPRFIHRRLVAAGDRVFVTLGYSAPVCALDAATGETIRVYDGTKDTVEILHDHGVLYLSIADAPKDSIGKSPPHRIMAVEADDGKVLWTAGPFPSIVDRAERGKKHVLKQGRLMIAVGAGRLVCVTDKQLLAFDAQTGRQAWTVDRPELIDAAPELDGKVRRRAIGRGIPNLGSLSIHDGRVYFTQPHAPKRGMVNQQGMTVLCLAADFGRLLWRGEHGDWTYTTNLSVYAARDLVWAHGLPREQPELLLGLDPATGKPMREIKIGAATRTRHHHRCYRNKATERFLLMGKEGVEYIDLDTGQVTPHRWLRGMCLYGIMPANGLLYVPPQACDCNAMSQLQGYLALAPAEGESPAAEPVPGRLVQGPAYSSPIHGTAAPEDWPMHRRNAHRDCRANAVGSALNLRWRTRAGGALSAPSVADGRVYLACNDRHEVIALGAETGDVLWRCAVGGAVDSAPTYYRGRLIFGCADGWIYCLRASDGEVAWRFCAAPSQRYVVDNGRVQSVWPVHGSVVVLGDTAYVLAGRSSYLDGGLRLWALDPLTGKARGKTVYSTVQDDQNDMAEGVVTDLLVRGGDSLFLRHVRIDPVSLAMKPTSAWGYGGPNPGPKGYTYLNSGQGFLDDSLFGRLRFRLEGNEDAHRLVFDEAHSYSVQLSPYSTKNVFLIPGAQGYRLICRSRSGPKGKLGDTRRRYLKKPREEKDVVWDQHIPVRPSAMALAGEVLLIGGSPDVIDADDPWAAIEGRKGGQIRALAADHGTLLAQADLPAPPVWDGLAVARGCVYLALTDGSVACLATR